MRGRACLLSVAVILLAGSPALGADYYVSTTGSDSGTGSVSSPWRTISKALATVADGDTILLLSGNYDFPNPPPKNRTTDYVTLRPAPGHEDAVQLNGYVRPNSNCDYLRFQNLRFGTGLHIDSASHLQVRGCSAPGSTTLYGIKVVGSDILIEGNIVSGGAKAYVFGGSNVTVRWNEAYNTTSDGFFMGSGTDVLFEGNYFHDNVPSAGAHPDFFQVYGGTPTTVRRITVRRNYFDTAGQGIFWERYTGTIEDVLAENNVIISTHARAWSVQTTNNVTCRNNTFMFPPEQGLTDPSGGGALCYMDAWGGGPYVFANNTCRYIGRPSNPNFIGRNYIIHEFTAVDPGSFNAPPTSYFEDFTNHDFRLKAGSAAVDGGDPAYAPTTDILGRPRDANPDIGAYEYNAADTESLHDMFVDIFRAEQAAIRGAEPPPAIVADAGPDQTVIDADEDGVEVVTLDGSGSSSGGHAIVSWVWKEGDATIATGETAEVELALGVHTIELTVTDDDDPAGTAADTVVVTVAESAPVASQDTWQSFPLAEQTGHFTVEFDARPDGANIDGVVGILSGTASAYTDLACIFRFYTSGNMDVRNGSGYAADVVAPYTAGTWYHVRMVIDIASHTYSVFVTPEGQAEFTLADGYAFRSEQSAVASLDHWALVHYLTAGLTVDNVRIVPPPELAVAGWAVVADHGPSGIIATDVSDGYIEPRLVGLEMLEIALTAEVDPATVVPGAVTIIDHLGGDVSSLIESMSLDPTGTSLAVALSSPLPDEETYTIAVTAILRGAEGQSVTGDADLVLHVLAGDADASGSVGAADLLAVRSHAGETPASDTARYDLDRSGAVTGQDLLAVRSRLSHALP